MVIVSVVTEPGVVDRILEYVATRGGDDPFAERAPPAEGGGQGADTLH
jgi:hypothetical protein